jgi:hypothetical protein
MAWTGETCGKCKRRHNVRFDVVPEEAWRTVVLNRWRVLCPQCFDAEAQIAGIRYSFTGIEGTSWSDLPPPRGSKKRKR